MLESRNRFAQFPITAMGRSFDSALYKKFFHLYSLFVKSTRCADAQQKQQDSLVFRATDPTTIVKKLSERNTSSRERMLKLDLQTLVLGFLVVTIAGVSALPSLADDAITECSSVKVYVRTIKASGPLDEQALASGSTNMEVGPGLEDISPKLEKLPFKSFKLLSSREEELPLRRKETLSLPNGQTITFRPVYLDNKRVGISLDWRDRGGSGILNTRVHFDAEESLLTGTDAGTELESDGGLILAIRAVPIPTHKDLVVPASAVK